MRIIITLLLLCALHPARADVRRMCESMSTNTEASGRFHTDWLNMMYPRLKMAKNLLNEDGVIFVSIDDNEIDQVF